ncbi:hypothetical protein IMSHALPRED_009223 [Imshaugia aleurites]|uniref:Uncharacterized protein n=1 Tax=Imshaugia aleurites TaxID=172621 RepID=A0A8H3IEC5_9LECA|nr:hypothetical protein IMSHALPRED_009223 [Imshaugia aleurites]
MPRHATTTPEAREIVAELEFLWDQVTSVSVSPSKTSPAEALASGAVQQSHLALYNTRNQQGGDALRVLRPLSNEAEEDELGDLDYERDDFTSSSLEHMQWKRRIKQAIGKMVVEIAALREQMEMTRLAGRG